MNPITMGIFSLFGSHNSNVANETSIIQNKFLQTSIEQCSTNCTNAIVGSTIVINNVDIGGNFEINQSCSINQGCTFNTTLQSSITNMINASAQQQNSTTNGILSIFSSTSQNNDFNYYSYMNNVVTQLMDAECRADSTNLMANDLIYLGNSNVAGNAVISESSNISNQCVMNNLAKILAMSQQTTAVNQSNVSRSGLVMLIAAIVILVIVLVVGALLILLALGGFGLIGGGKAVAGGSSDKSAGAAGKSGLASEAGEAAKLALLA